MLYKSFLIFGLAFMKLFLFGNILFGGTLNSEPARAPDAQDILLRHELEEEFKQALYPETSKNLNFVFPLDHRTWLTAMTFALLCLFAAPSLRCYLVTAIEKAHTYYTFKRSSLKTLFSLEFLQTYSKKKADSNFLNSIEFKLHVLLDYCEEHARTESMTKIELPMGCTNTVKACETFEKLYSGVAKLVFCRLIGLDFINQNIRHILEDGKTNCASFAAKSHENGPAEVIGLKKPLDNDISFTSWERARSDLRNLTFDSLNISGIRESKEIVSRFKLSKNKSLPDDSRLHVESTNRTLQLMLQEIHVNAHWMYRILNLTCK